MYVNLAIEHPKSVVSASNYDVVSIAGNLLVYTTPSFEALTFGLQKPTIHDKYLHPRPSILCVFHKRNLEIHGG